jgi:hypothetical protein
MPRSLPWLLFFVTGVLRAEVINVSEGTNLSLAIHPDNEFIAIDLLGGLFRLPISGGGATALIPAGSGVAQPRFDPAGETIVFQRWQNGQWDIWQFNLATGNYQPLTETEFNEREPDVSADGRQVVFASDRSGRYSLWSLDYETQALRQLTDEPGEARFPTFGDSGELAYVNIGAARSEVRLYSGGPRGMPMVSTGRRIDAPSFRPGGGVLVINQRVAGGNDLWLHIDADEPVTRRLTSAEDVFVGRAGWFSPEEYVYAADGALWRRTIGSLEKSRILLFAGISVDEIATDIIDRRLDAPGPHPVAGINGLVRHDASGLAAFTALGDLWLIDDDAIIRLTDDSATDAWPTFTPDGAWLVFASDRDGEMSLWRRRIESGQTLKVSDGPARAFSPRVSGDGRYVAFLETDRDAPWDSATLRLIEFDHPFQPMTLATGLFEASDLEWQGEYLRVTARDSLDAEAYLHVYETVAGSEQFPLTIDQDPLPELQNNEALAWRPIAAEAPYVIQAGRLFDGTSSQYRYHVDIHIEGQRITDIVGRDQLPVPDRVVDFSELTIVPGLIDVHSHLASVAGAEAGKRWLSAGVTTVRDVTPDWRRAVERAETWASGRQLGPRVVIAPLDADTDVDLSATSPIIVSRGRRILGGGIHAFADQWARDDTALTGLPPLPLQADTAGGPRLAFSATGRSYNDVFGQLQASRVYFSTGLGALRNTQTADESGRLIDAFERLMRASGLIAIGSDAPAVAYGTGFHDELALLAAQGVPEDQLLRFATASGAVALGLSLDLGTLERGRLADMVAIDGDPLNRIGELKRIEAVVIGGVLHEIESLRSD